MAAVAGEVVAANILRRRNSVRKVIEMGGGTTLAASNCGEMLVDTIVVEPIADECFDATGWLRVDRVIGVAEPLGDALSTVEAFNLAMADRRSDGQKRAVVVGANSGPRVRAGAIIEASDTVDWVSGGRSPVGGATRGGPESRRSHALAMA